MPAIATQYYLINEVASASTTIDFDLDIYWGPSWWTDTYDPDSNDYYGGSMDISQAVSGSDPSWATLDAANPED